MDLEDEDENFFFSSSSEDSCLRDENIEDIREGFEDEDLHLDFLSSSLSLFVRDDEEGGAIPICKLAVGD